MSVGTTRSNTTPSAVNRTRRSPNLGEALGGGTSLTRRSLLRPGLPDAILGVGGEVGRGIDAFGRRITDR